MNSEPYRQNILVGPSAIAILVVLLGMGWVVWRVWPGTIGPSPDDTRGAERMAIMKQFQADNLPLLNNYDWQDQAHGIVRIPIESAKAKILEEWQDPEAGRSNLMARAAKAFAPLPKAPAPKNEYE